MNRLPLSVISGYLGAGKTTLINRLLSEDHGLRLMVMVNDFGAINIDQALIRHRDKDVIALTNGCVCCTMGADLFMALGDVLDRRPRPDHLIIEASGIADPKAIANTAKAEPELSYAGIITLVDASQIAALLADRLIAPQVKQQISAADLVLLSKAAQLGPALHTLFDDVGLPLPEVLGDGRICDLLLDVVPKPGTGVAAGHGAYTTWHQVTDKPIDHAGFERLLAARPKHLFRLKGFVWTQNGGFEVQVVGSNLDLRPSPKMPAQASLVGLGLRERIMVQDIEAWWQSL